MVAKPTARVPCNLSELSAGKEGDNPGECKCSSILWIQERAAWIRSSPKDNTCLAWSILAPFGWDLGRENGYCFLPYHGQVGVEWPCPYRWWAATLLFIAIYERELKHDVYIGLAS